MVKKTNNKKRSLSFPSVKAVLLVYAVLASTLSLVVQFQFMHGYSLQQKYFAETGFKQLVRDSQLAIYEKPSVSTADNRLYFPTMKLSIPFNNDTMQILYGYEEAVSDEDYTSPAIATFVSKSATYNAAKSMEQFSCSVLAKATFDKKESSFEGDGFKYVGEVKLGDGRTVHMYQNTKNVCSSVWASLDSDGMIELLKQATSN